MMDVDEVIEMLSKLSYEEALAYWISGGEREEAKLYKELAREQGRSVLGRVLSRSLKSSQKTPRGTPRS